MSTPADAATQDNLEDADINTPETDLLEGDEPEDEASIKEFENTVSEVVNQMKRNKDGKFVFPEGTTAEVRFAALTEKRRRDTQAEYTKVAQQSKALEAENTTLKKRVLGEIKLTLTDEQVEELEELKFSDIDAWRKKMNKLENDAIAARQKEVDEELGQVSAEVLAKDELKRRAKLVEAFNKENPDIKLTDEFIQNDIPPRITKRLETGEISFEAFLQEVFDYTKTGKVVKQEPLRGQPNLSKVGGSSKPDKHAENEDIVLSYNKEVF